MVRSNPYKCRSSRTIGGATAGATAGAIAAAAAGTTAEPTAGATSETTAGATSEATAGATSEEASSCLRSSLFSSQQIPRSDDTSMSLTHC